MSGGADQKQDGALLPRGLTRRGFIQTASVSAAGAALAAGCAPKKHDHHIGGHLHGPVRPTSIAVDREQKLAVTSDDQNRVILWDVSGEPGQIDSFKEHDKKAAFVAIAQGKVFSASYDGRVFVTDLLSTSRKTPRLVFTKHRDDCGPGTEVWVVGAAERGNRAVSATNGGQILVWRHDTGAVLGTCRDSDEPVGGLAFVGADGNQFLSTHGHGRVVLWDVRDPTVPRKVQEFSHGNSHLVNSVSASPDGSVIASGSFDMTVLLWEAASGKRLLEQPIRHDDWVWRVAFSPDPEGKHVACASQDGSVRVWEATSGKLVDRANVGEGGSMGVAWLDEKTVIYTGNGTGDFVRMGQLGQLGLRDAK